MLTRDISIVTRLTELGFEKDIKYDIEHTRWEASHLKEGLQSLRFVRQPKPLTQRGQSLLSNNLIPIVDMYLLSLGE